MPENFDKNIQNSHPKTSAWPRYFHDKSVISDFVHTDTSSYKKVDKREDVLVKDYSAEFLGDVDDSILFHQLKEKNVQLWKDIHDIKHIFDSSEVNTEKKILRFNENGGHFFCPSLKEIFLSIKTKESRYYVVRKKKKIVAFIVAVGRHYQTHQDILTENKTQFESETIIKKILELDHQKRLVVFDDLVSLESGFTTYFLLINFFKELKALGYEEGIAEVYSLFTEEALKQNVMGSIPNVSLKLMHCLAPSYLGYFKEKINYLLKLADNNQEIPLVIKRNLYQVNIQKGLKELQKLMERHFRLVL